MDQSTHLHHPNHHLPHSVLPITKSIKRWLVTNSSTYLSDTLVTFIFHLWKLKYILFILNVVVVQSFLILVIVVEFIFFI